MTRDEGLLSVERDTAGDRLARGLIGDVLYNYAGSLSPESLAEVAQSVVDVLREAGFVLSARSGQAREIQGAYVEAKAHDAIRRWAEAANSRSPMYQGYIAAKRRRAGGVR